MLQLERAICGLMHRSLFKDKAFPAGDTLKVAAIPTELGFVEVNRILGHLSLGLDCASLPRMGTVEPIGLRIEELHHASQVGH